MNMDKALELARVTERRRRVEAIRRREIERRRAVAFEAYFAARLALVHADDVRLSTLDFGPGYGSGTQYLRVVIDRGEAEGTLEGSFPIPIRVTETGREELDAGADRWLLDKWARHVAAAVETMRAKPALRPGDRWLWDTRNVGVTIERVGGGHVMVKMPGGGLAGYMKMPAATFLAEARFLETAHG